ncbi:hypothetical protein BABINDRAFT_171869 [Babjeviella inositovora NRRL Y-12698]|uniref:Major facilitator superfamily (MFS) profile domain-containing protein n=1 Tax=Babjeviella inositovora NRRL Y-12698 TaxID=984486 RepID=A0A1E3QN45_9ASCO|nr:uncharacterized protein BABINDRAFT_171869 [Babjeviella inositovora NRRL Y-12698]ODQ79058.1 hypothetical protein BABINDRAFT_171869 [Babjeviella inositovora NRRL Y-12698]
MGDLNFGQTSTLRPRKDDNLPAVDRPAFFLLVLLYMLQGVPVGLAFGSVPFILKSHLSYAQVGIFSLAAYPYSLKLLWSPIIDAIFYPKLGRRRSWIIPVQLFSGLTLIFLGLRIETLLERPEENLTAITSAFFCLVFLCATQDIAVDGWALTILSPSALSFASTAQTIGINTGYFSSFTVFLAFNSPEFANKYLRKVPIDAGLVSLNGYLKFWGVMYLLITCIVMVVPEYPRHLAKYQKSGKRSTGLRAIANVYRSMFQVLKLRNVQLLILIHLVCKIGFQTNEAATNLKLLERGFLKEDLAITVLIDFPFEIIFGYYAARWSNGKSPLTPWLYGYLGRLLSAALAQFLVYNFPANGEVTKGYFVAVIMQHLLGSFMLTIQFVSICAFHTNIADPLIGGTYMTTLNTLSNFGGQWPRIIVLSMIDTFTVSTCQAPEGASPLEYGFSCVADAGKELCKALGGLCETTRDGYYYTNTVCIVLGLLIWVWLKKQVGGLQSLPISSWRVVQVCPRQK